MNIGRFLGFGPNVSVAEQGKIIDVAAVTAPDEIELVKSLIVLSRKLNNVSRWAPIKVELTADDLATCTNAIKNNNSAVRDEFPNLVGPQGFNQDEAGKLLDMIEHLKERHYRLPITKTTDRATFETARIDTFRYPKMQAIARAIAESPLNHVGDTNTLDVAALEQASTIMREKGAAGLFALVPTLENKQISALENAKEVEQGIDFFKAWFDRGRNGIANHGTVVVNGVELSSVFRVGQLPQYKIQGEAPEGQRLTALDQMMDEYEQGINYKGVDRVGLSRVYIDGGDGNLYIGIRNDGDIQRITRGDACYFRSRPLDQPTAIASSDPASLTRNASTPERLGKVVRVVSVAHSPINAAAMAGKSMLLATFGKASKRADEGLPLYVTSSYGPAPYYQGAGVTDPNMSRMGGFSRLMLTGLGSGVAALGGGYMGTLVTWTGLATMAVGVGAAIGAIAGGAAVLYMLGRKLMPQSINPLLSAAGIAANRELSADEF